jgi:hypothetical protein
MSDLGGRLATSASSRSHQHASHVRCDHDLQPRDSSAVWTVNLRRPPAGIPMVSRVRVCTVLALSFVAGGQRVRPNACALRQPAYGLCVGTLVPCTQVPHFLYIRAKPSADLGFLPLGINVH